MQIDFNKFLASSEMKVLRTYARNVSKNTDLAEDIIQTAFLRAIRTDGWNPAKGTALVYLKLLVWSSFKDLLDYNRVRGFDREVSFDAVSTLGSFPEPVDSARTSGKKAEVSKLLRKLPRMDRQILRWRYLAGYTFEEIAVKLGKKKAHKAWVRWRVNRALEILRVHVLQGGRMMQEKSELDSG